MGGREELSIDVVHRLKVVHVRKIDGRANDGIERQVCRGEHSPEIFENSPRLSGHVPFNHPAGHRIERDLTGNEQQVARANSLRVRADGLRSLRAPDDNLQENSRSLDDLMGSQAPRTDANAPGRAIDCRADTLKVRLEPARADVVSVADLPSDDGCLSANLAALGHVELSVLEQIPSISAELEDYQG
jgi:hypothetical protein